MGAKKACGWTVATCIPELHSDTQVVGDASQSGGAGAQGCGRPLLFLPVSHRLVVKSTLPASEPALQSFTFLSSWEIASGSSGIAHHPDNQKLLSNNLKKSFKTIYF